ncbi:MAG: hypothetical protein ACPL4C_05825 [Brevinematia bacterium]
MRSWIIRAYGVVIFVLFLVVVFFIGRYVYLKLTFEKIEREIREYENIPYLSRKVDFLESEYIRINNLIREMQTPALVIGKIMNIFEKYNVKVDYVSRENYEEGEVYKVKINGNFRDVLLALGEVENSFLPIKFTRVEMYGRGDIVVNLNIMITE